MKQASVSKTPRQVVSRRSQGNLGRSPDSAQTWAQQIGARRERSKLMPSSYVDVLALQRIVGNRRVAQQISERRYGPMRANPSFRVQKSEGEEHEQLGNAATGTADTDLSIGHGQVLTFGEMTALAGRLRACHARPARS